MGHEPPVPPGNTSPYPIQEPPHAPSAPSASKAAAPTVERKQPSLGALFGIAAGIGALAIGVAALLFSRESSAMERKPNRRKR